ncbi:MAG: hypothetical protein WCG23_08415 [bacterium]
MDMLPIKPTSNNLIRPTTGTANDGGSKSQGGYINVRTGKTDELKISDEGKRLIGDDPVVDEKSFLTVIKEFILLVLNTISKIFSFKIPKNKRKPKIAEKAKTNEENEKSEVKNFLGFTRHEGQ